LIHFLYENELSLSEEKNFQRKHSKFKEIKGRGRGEVEGIGFLKNQVEMRFLFLNLMICFFVGIKGMESHFIFIYLHFLGGFWKLK